MGIEIAETCVSCVEADRDETAAAKFSLSKVVPGRVSSACDDDEGASASH